MEVLIHFITALGVPAILATIFAESGLLIGFFLPGDSLLFVSGILVSQDILAINVHLFVVLLFIAAVTGDSVGYAFGRKVGPSIFKRKNNKLFNQDNLQRAKNFYDKHGAKTIFLARFVPFVRTFAPIIAGVTNMHYRTFLIYNLAGGALWTAGFVYLGYFLGEYIEKLGINIEVAALLIIVLSLMPALVHILREPETRDKLIARIKTFQEKFLWKK